MSFALPGWVGFPMLRSPAKAVVMLGMLWLGSACLGPLVFFAALLAGPSQTVLTPAAAFLAMGILVSVPTGVYLGMARPRARVPAWMDTLQETGLCLVVSLGVGLGTGAVWAGLGLSEGSVMNINHLSQEDEPPVPPTEALDGIIEVITEAVRAGFWTPLAVLCFVGALVTLLRGMTWILDGDIAPSEETRKPHRHGL